MAGPSDKRSRNKKLLMESINDRNLSTVTNQTWYNRLNIQRLENQIGGGITTIQPGTGIGIAGTGTVADPMIITSTVTPGSTTFTGLTDTPAGYGSTGQYLTTDGVGNLVYTTASIDVNYRGVVTPGVTNLDSFAPIVAGDWWLSDATGDLDTGATVKGVFEGGVIAANVDMPLAGDVVNTKVDAFVPFYTVPNLQQVTDVGNVTTNSMQSPQINSQVAGNIKWYNLNADYFSIGDFSDGIGGPYDGNWGNYMTFNDPNAAGEGTFELVTSDPILQYSGQWSFLQMYKNTASLRNVTAGNGSAVFEARDGLVSISQRNENNFISTIRVEPAVVSLHEYFVPARSDAPTQSYFALGITDGVNPIEYATSEGIINIAPLLPVFSGNNLQAVLEADLPTQAFAESPDTLSYYNFGIEDGGSIVKIHSELPAGLGSFYSEIDINKGAGIKMKSGELLNNSYAEFESSTGNNAWREVKNGVQYLISVDQNWSQTTLIKFPGITDRIFNGWIPLEIDSKVSDVEGRIQLTHYYDFACSDETTVITAGTVYEQILMRDLVVSSFDFSYTTAPTTDAEFDVRLNGVSVFTTTARIDANEFSTLTATQQQVITGGVATFAPGDRLTVIAIDPGTGAIGLKAQLTYTIS